MTTLELEPACRAVIDETNLLLDAADNAGWDADVPSCPEWTVTKLVLHLGRTHRSIAEMVRRGADGPVDSRDLEGTDPDRDPAALRAWLTRGAADLHQVLAEAGESRTVWSFVPGLHTSMFWARRMAHETTTHRMDAQLAAGGPKALTCSYPQLHADGITEGLALLTAVVPTERSAGSGQTVHAHATDDALDGEWVVTRGADGASWEHAHVKADVAVRARVHLLQAVLTRRLSPDDERVEVIGDRAVLDDWLELGRL